MRLVRLGERAYPGTARNAAVRASRAPLLALIDRPNFILTPHVAWAGRQAQQAIADQVTENIEAFVRGAPRNVV